MQAVAENGPLLCVFIPRDGAPVAAARHPGSLNELLPEWPSAGAGELLVFRPGQRMFRTTLQVAVRACRRATVVLPATGLLEVSARVWICGSLAARPDAAREAEWQLAAVNQCLATGAAPADSGIRLRLLELRLAPALSLHRPEEIDCFSPMAEASPEADVVDIYLHNQPFRARACPIYRRIFLGYPGLHRFTLAHEFAHLLGMPQRAHVDDNPYLERGNVMDNSPPGGIGALTLGQLCIFNLHVHSLAARIRANREPRFPLRRMIDERGCPMKGPSLGFHFPTP
ncbi:MAG: hypothetical protein U5J83_06185 [Bryobacterales bacterium]|nr:hypothetical protein [Bryobacterales bacterium]